ncbi:Isocitrate lyase and phosphorylmutase [Shewanella piezotolerans WP3]|uniref:Isocitrate lyase and phosphorylmutase n=1 Tax=Shewanella piezotolerans (strain WP3 / JCM 13877) TaxID=225849 RepID=B8CPB8_SHEPW|nr:Isocitrate lyase and phosphorylmutase [Shewanella piezotolerans WP3]
MTNYRTNIDEAATLINAEGSAWNAINPESVARMRLQNRFKLG